MDALLCSAALGSIQFILYSFCFNVSHHFVTGFPKPDLV